MEKNRRVQHDEGGWEPMMLVAALGVVVWLGLNLYGDRVFPEAQTVAARPAVATQAIRPQQPPANK